MNLIDVLKPSLALRARKIALEALPASEPGSSLGVRYCFADLERLSSLLAGFLGAQGVARGERVCVYTPNSPWVALLLLATWKLGAIYVPINSLYRRREVAHILADADPKVLVVDASLRQFASQALRQCSRQPFVLVHPGDLLAAAQFARPHLSPCPASGDDPAGIFYTSGTTGRAKGAVLSHNNLSFNAIVLHSSWQWQENDTILLSLPLAHLHGLANGLLGALLAGAEILLLERFAAPRVAELLTGGRTTVFFGVPTMYARLLEPQIDLGARDLARVRLFVSGSAPLAADLNEKFRSLTGHAILERYGLTEALMVASNPYFGERRPGSVGLPLPGVSVRIVTGAGDDAGPGEEGELWVKGANVFRGYWRNPEATRETFSGAWLKTGDIASQSPDGYLTIRGRAKELIICGGYNIYPREVEEVIESASGVREAAVAAMAHAAKGEVPAAFVVPQPGHRLSWPALEEHCRQHLAEFKVPRAWQQVEKLPRNALGKILRHALLGRPGA